MVNALPLGVNMLWKDSSPGEILWPEAFRKDALRMVSEVDSRCKGGELLWRLEVHPIHPLWEILYFGVFPAADP